MRSRYSFILASLSADGLERAEQAARVLYEHEPKFGWLLREIRNVRETRSDERRSA